VRTVKDHLKQIAPDSEPRDHVIAEAIKVGQIDYYGNSVDLTELIEEAKTLWLDQAASQATQLWGSGSDLWAILITGGGSHLIGEALRTFFSKHNRVIVNANQLANATGFFRYGQYALNG